MTMTKSMKKQILTIILGVCIVIPRIIMPTTLTVTKPLVWVEMLLELTIGVLVIFINRESLAQLLKMPVKVGKFIRNTILILLGTRICAGLVSAIVEGVCAALFNVDYETLYDPAAAVGLIFQATAIVPVIITQTIVAPVTEELVFRKTVGDLISNKFLYLVVSTCLFGFIHAGMFINLSILTYIIYGLGFNIAYLVCKKDIRPVIAAHMLGNIIACIASVVGG